jgi:hypothetical protein
VVFRPIGREPPTENLERIDAVCEPPDHGSLISRPDVLAMLVEAGVCPRLPSDMHSYALIPIGYPMGRFGPVRRATLTEGRSSRTDGASRIGMPRLV